MYWGQFGIAKVSVGAFDVQGLTKGDSDVLYAGRVQDFILFDYTAGMMGSTTRAHNVDARIRGGEAGIADGGGALGRDTALLFRPL